MAFDISGMVSGLQSSIDAAVKRVQAQAQSTSKKTGDVEEFQQEVNKSKLNASMFSTNIGTLVKDTSRLNVLSTLAAKDPGDFYSMNVTSAGKMTIGRVGDEGVRVQVMNRQGKILADSNKDAGEAYTNYQKLEKDGLDVASGKMTLRITRDPGIAATKELNYGVQFRMGDYKQDYDTIAKQPAKDADPLADFPKLNSLASILLSNPTRSSLTDMMLSGTGSRGRGALLNTVL